MENTVSQAVLQPVMMAVPDIIASWTGRRRVLALSRLARAAARQSARQSGVVLGRMAKDNDGVPLPASGWFWSVSHKPSFVAGVAGPTRLGIDIESVRPRSRNLFHKIADRKEWQLGDEDEWQLFYRFWTAKEAVLKAVGIGMRGLSDCRIVAVKDPHHLKVSYRGEIWQVGQSMAHGHLAALAQNDRPVRWRWPPMGQTQD